MEIRLITNYFNAFRNVNRYSALQNKTNNQNAAGENSSKQLKSLEKPLLQAYPAGFYLPVSFYGIRLEDYKEKIVEMYQQGKTLPEIAKVIGCHPSRAGKALKRWGVPPHHRTRFIEAQKDKIIEMYQQGKTLTEIAEAIGSHSSVVWNGLKRWGVLVPAYKLENDKDKIIEMYQQGKSHEEIAEAVGCHPASAGKALKKWGMPARYRIEAQKDKIIEMYQQGKTLTEIAEAIGCTPPGAGAALKRWGVPPHHRTGSRKAQKDKIIETHQQEKTPADAGSALERGEISSWQTKIENSKYEIMEMYQQGKTYKEIAKLIGCSTNTIRNAVVRWEEEALADEDIEIIASMYKKGASFDEISEKTGNLPHAAESALRRHGLLDI